MIESIISTFFSTSIVGVPSHGIGDLTSLLLYIQQDQLYKNFFGEDFIGFKNILKAEKSENFEFSISPPPRQVYIG